MIIQRTQSAMVRTLAVLAIVAASFGMSVSDASAKNCYRVVNASHLNVRAKPTRFSSVLTSIKGGTLVEKSGLPVCGVWWCKVETGSDVGYVGSKYLEKVDCP